MSGELSAGSVAGFTAEQVEEVRMVVRMFPIFLTTIFYWTIYSQASAFSPPTFSLICTRCLSAGSKALLSRCSKLEATSQCLRKKEHRRMRDTCTGK